MSEIFHGKREERHFTWEGWYGWGERGGEGCGKTEQGSPEVEDFLGHYRTRSDPTEGAGSKLGAVLGPEPKSHLWSLLFLVTLPRTLPNSSSTHTFLWYSITIFFSSILPEFHLLLLLQKKARNRTSVFLSPIIVFTTYNVLMCARHRESNFYILSQDVTIILIL